MGALGCGAIAALSQPPVSIPWVLFLAIPALFVLWSQAGTARRAFWIGWFAGVGYFAASMFWIAEPFLVDAATFGWMIPFAVTGLAGGLALFWAAGFWLAHRVGAAGWTAPFAFVGGWLALEWLRGNILTGFPWGLLGYAWIDTPAMQSAAWLGIYGVTLWTVLIGALLGAAVLARKARARVACAVAAIAVVAAAWLVDGPEAPQRTDDAPRLKVGLVQPNIAQRDKWRPELREAHLELLLDETGRLSAQGADVVIWPEAASPYSITEAPRLRQMIAERLKPGGILLAGGLRFEGRGTPGQRVFNSLMAVDSRGAVVATYDKQHLVPFGEFLPYDAFFTGLGLRALAALPGGMSAGDGAVRQMTVPGLPAFTPMICYEAVFPAEILPRDSDTQWLVHATNDAWFGSLAGPYQHLVQARVRAIERGLPIARAANTGVSAMIDPRGRIVGSVALDTGGVILADLPHASPPTLYRRYEDLPFGILLALTFLIAGFGRRTARQAKASDGLT